MVAAFDRFHRRTTGQGRLNLFLGFFGPVGWALTGFVVLGLGGGVLLARVSFNHSSPPLAIVTAPVDEIVYLPPTGESLKASESGIASAGVVAGASVHSDSRLPSREVVESLRELDGIPSDNRIFPRTTEDQEGVQNVHSSLAMRLIATARRQPIANQSEPFQQGYEALEVTVVPETEAVPAIFLLILLAVGVHFMNRRGVGRETSGG